MICCNLLEAYSFLMNDRKRVDPDRKGSRTELRGVKVCGGGL